MDDRYALNPHRGDHPVRCVVAVAEAFRTEVRTSMQVSVADAFGLQRHGSALLDEDSVTACEDSNALRRMSAVAAANRTRAAAAVPQPDGHTVCSRCMVSAEPLPKAPVLRPWFDQLRGPTGHVLTVEGRDPRTSWAAERALMAAEAVNYSRRSRSRSEDDDDDSEETARSRRRSKRERRGDKPKVFDEKLNAELTAKAKELVVQPVVRRRRRAVQAPVHDDVLADDDTSVAPMGRGLSLVEAAETPPVVNEWSVPADPADRVHPLELERRIGAIFDSIMFAIPDDTRAAYQLDRNDDAVRHIAQDLASRLLHATGRILLGHLEAAKRYVSVPGNATRLLTHHGEGERRLLFQAALAPCGHQRGQPAEDSDSFDESA